MRFSGTRITHCGERNVWKNYPFSTCPPERVRRSTRSVYRKIRTGNDLLFYKRRQAFGVETNCGQTHESYETQKSIEREKKKRAVRICSISVRVCLIVIRFSRIFRKCTSPFLVGDTRSRSRAYVRLFRIPVPSFRLRQIVTDCAYVALAFRLQILLFTDANSIQNG